MKNIAPNETELIGRWIVEGKTVEADAVCRRIESLVKGCLVRLGADSSGWDTLYRDPLDGRLWELIYPHSELPAVSVGHKQCGGYLSAFGVVMQSLGLSYDQTQNVAGAAQIAGCAVGKGSCDGMSGFPLVAWPYGDQKSDALMIQKGWTFENLKRNGKCPQE